jgi:hypothetical protein
MTKLAITPLIAIGLAAAAAAILPAPPVSAAGPQAGTACPSDQLGTTATTSGTTVRCLTNGQGGFRWMADTGAAGTIAQLQSQGYTVNIDRVGSGPLSACTVTDVRNPNTITRTIRGPQSGHGQLVTITVSKTVQVSLHCTGG